MAAAAAAAVAAAAAAQEMKPPKRPPREAVAAAAAAAVAAAAAAQEMKPKRPPRDVDVTIGDNSFPMPEESAAYIAAYLDWVLNSEEPSADAAREGLGAGFEMRAEAVLLQIQAQMKREPTVNQLKLNRKFINHVRGFVDRFVTANSQDYGESPLEFAEEEWIDHVPKKWRKAAEANLLLQIPEFGPEGVTDFESG